MKEDPYIQYEVDPVLLALAPDPIEFVVGEHRPFIEGLIAFCKEHGIPFAGRLKVTVVLETP